MVIKKEILKYCILAIFCIYNSALQGQDSNSVYLNCRVLIIDSIANIAPSIGPHYQRTKLLLCEVDSIDLKRIGLSDCVKNRIVVRFASSESEVLNEGGRYTLLIDIEYLSESVYEEQGRYRSPCSGYVLRENDRVRYGCKEIKK